MRKLASIQRVLAINPIPEADMIELVDVLGWHVVCKKNEMKVGDLIVYCEVDSVFPEKEEFEFLRNCKFRIKTKKIRGVFSQGICFPLSILPKGEYNEDDDVSSILGIAKYEPPEPACLGGNTKGSFPSFMIKTDETRVQVLQGLLTKYKGTVCYISEKADGSSCSTFFNNRLDFADQFGVCSRNQELKRDEPEIGEYSFSAKNTFWAMAEKYDLEYKLRQLNKNLGIQGEVIGEGIQKNKYEIKGHELRVFNIFDIDQFRYLDFSEFIDLSATLGLTTVPILDTNFTLIDDIDALVELSKGNSVLNLRVKREGIVIRPLIEINDPKFGRISFKAINPEFLCKYSDD